jgi:hypothetical protein
MFPAELMGQINARVESGGESPIYYAKTYWAMVSEVCGKAWFGGGSREEIDEATGRTIEVPIKYRLKDLVGVASLSRLAREIISRALEHKDPTAMIRERVAKLEVVDWEKRNGNLWMTSQAGFSGQADCFKLLFDWVFNNKRPDDDQAN